MGRRRAQESARVQAVFRFSRFSSAYRSRLLAGLLDVQNFLSATTSLSLHRVLDDPSLANEVLGCYVMSRHETHPAKSLSTVKHGLLGCQHLKPTIKGRLLTPWENLRVWEERKTTQLRPPLPVAIWCVMVGLARGHGLATSNLTRKFEWLCLASLLEIGFLCLLRPGELLKLKHSDFSFPGSFTNSHSHASIRVAAPKNRRQFGEQQFVTLGNPSAIEWLRLLCCESSEEKLWPSKPHRFVRLFKQLLKELQVDCYGFVPASLRPGGATMLYGCGIPNSTLRFIGRWTVEKSLEHYIQQATATQILNRLSEKSIRRLSSVAAACLVLVPAPKCRGNLAFLSQDISSDGPSIISWCNSYAQLVGEAGKEKGGGWAPQRGHL